MRVKNVITLAGRIVTNVNCLPEPLPTCISQQERELQFQHLFTRFFLREISQIQTGIDTRDQKILRFSNGERPNTAACFGVSMLSVDSLAILVGNILDARYLQRRDVSIGNVLEHKGQHVSVAVYGVDRNDVLIKRAQFIEEQIREQNEQQITRELLTTKLSTWLYKFKRGQLKPNAFDRLESTYLHQILPALQECNLIGIKLKDVTATNIQGIMDCNLEKGYSYSTLKKTRYLLKEFFDFYEDELPKNPMAKHRFYKKDVVIEKQNSLRSAKSEALERIAMQKTEIVKTGTSQIYVSEADERLAHMRLKSQRSQKDVHVFTNEEIQKIKDAIEHGYQIGFTSRSGNEVKSGHYYPKQGLFFLFMLNTGIRGGEAVALKYSDFDFENNTVQIHSTAVNAKVRNKDGSATGKRNHTFTSPKTDHSDALLHLSPRAVQIITDMRAQEPPGYDGFGVQTSVFNFSLRRNDFFTSTSF